VKKFEEHGTVADAAKSGRPSVCEQTITEVQECCDVGLHESATGCFSANQISGSTGIPYSTVNKIFKYKLNRKPYHLKMLHNLLEHDYADRLAFAHWFLDQPEEFLGKVIWSDEVCFYLDGYVCSKNCVIWATDNPHNFITKPLHPRKVTVWCGFTSET